MRTVLTLILAAILATPTAGQTPAGPTRPGTTPLVIGETFTIASKALGETRRVNVYAARGYSPDTTAPLPVLYMPDGGIGEDFLHVAGLLQVSVANGTMRPFLLVGIENTQRRRDLTGPTENAEDRKIAPQVGGSAAYRAFLRDELVPWVNAHYRTTSERAIVGESLAGLFVVETFLLEPALFDTYVAFDPSLWWNDHRLLDSAATRLAAGSYQGKRLWLAASSEWELAALTARLASVLQRGKFPGLWWHYEPMPAETHATIYHPAALVAFRALFAPAQNR
ncbi:MAG TPA: alpha/beta hydrolase-fold protein [Gemmatimonadaceae bacterium]